MWASNRLTQVGIVNNFLQRNTLCFYGIECGTCEATIKQNCLRSIINQQRDICIYCPLLYSQYILYIYMSTLYSIYQCCWGGLDKSPSWVLYNIPDSFCCWYSGNHLYSYIVCNFLQPCQFINQILVFRKLFVYDTELVGSMVYVLFIYFIFIIFILWFICLVKNTFPKYLFISYHCLSVRFLNDNPVRMNEVK